MAKTHPGGSGFAPATTAAFALLEAFVAHGLQWIVLSPGSRSQALALAAAALEAEGRLRMLVRIDERDAAFTALGIGLETGRPAAIITTSGTAAVNLHPAVREAHHAGVPLIALTADRPEELRGIGSNQTTDQTHLFGDVRWSADVPAPESGDIAPYVDLAAIAWRAALGVEPARRPRSGPVHLNLAFREPLSSAGRPPALVIAPESPDRPEAASRCELGRGPRTVVVAGAGSGERAEEVAHEGGWPLIAEVTSGARFGRNLVSHYRGVLDDSELASRIERVIVFGHPTLSRQVMRLVTRTDIDVVVVRGPGGEDVNPGRRASAIVDAVEVGPGEGDSVWLGEWLAAGRELVARREATRAKSEPAIVAPDVAASRSSDMADRRAFVEGELAAVRTPLTRESLVEAVWRATWPHDRLLFGASRLIRVADDVVPGKKVPVFGNRGLAGIDGTVATGWGIAAASGVMTRVVLGDLALLHDVGGMFAQPGEARPHLQVIVGNDGGGTIFDSLEVAQAADSAVMTRVMFTPQSVRLADLASAYGWHYRLATTVGELDQALVESTDAPTLIEVPLSR